MRTQTTYWNAPPREGSLISDLSTCSPQSSISSKPTQNRWYTIPYTTRDGIKGVMLAKGGSSHPPDVNLCLPAEGWHAIYLGVFSGGQERIRQRLRLKLSDESLFETTIPSGLGYRLSPKSRMVGRPGPIPGSENGIEEFLWKAADLQGQELVVSHFKNSDEAPIHLSFVRLVPMTQQEVNDYRNAEGSADTRLLAAEVDGQFYHDGAVRSVEDLQEMFEPLRNTDVGKLFLGTAGIGAGIALYPTQAGAPVAAGNAQFLNEPSRRMVEAWQGFLDRGVDPLKVCIDYVHSMGIEVYLGFRMGTMAMAPPSWGDQVPFWEEHPEWRCCDREGRTIPRLSMAYSQVRRFYVQLFEELAAYGVEGVQPIYVRRPPFVLFEPPVIEAFKREYGIDPRELPDDPQRRMGWYTTDTRLMQHWAKYVTAFMRELRQGLTRYSRPDGGPMRIVANVMHNADSNSAGAMDLKTWAQQGLVDIFCPFTGGDGSAVVDYDYFGDITEGTTSLFYEDITPRCMPGRRYAEHARRAYAGGAAGLAFWDSGARIMTKSQWHTIRQLGHRTRLDDLALQPEDYLVHPLELMFDWNPETRYL